MVHVFFAGVMIHLMYGKRKDPYQASEDRDRQIGIGVKSIIFIGNFYFFKKKLIMSKFDFLKSLMLKTLTSMLKKNTACLCSSLKYGFRDFKLIVLFFTACNFTV